MPVKLTISKVPNVSNFTNSALIKDSYQYMVENDSSKRNQNNYLKVIIISDNNTISGFKDKEKKIQTENGLPLGTTICTE